MKEYTITIYNPDGTLYQEFKQDAGFVLNFFENINKKLFSSIRRGEDRFALTTRRKYCSTDFFGCGSDACDMDDIGNEYIAAHRNESQEWRAKGYETASYFNQFLNAERFRSFRLRENYKFKRVAAHKIGSRNLYKISDVMKIIEEHKAKRGGEK